MQFQQMVTFIHDAWLDQVENPGNPTPVISLGPPGIGKSSVKREAAKKMAQTLNRRFVDLLEEPEFGDNIDDVVLFYAADLSSKLPEDLGGLPRNETFEFFGHRNLVTRHSTQSWAMPFCHPKAVGHICLDDLAASTPAVQVAARQTLLDRKLGDAKIAPGVFLSATGNRREDKSAASTLPAHLRNTVTLLTLEPNMESWAEWYGREERHAPIVASFLRWKPGHFSKLPKDADALGAFATPRQWAKLGRLFAVADKSDNLHEVAAGMVGEGVALEFMAFKNVRSQLVDPGRVLDNPQAALPNPREALSSPDRAHAMTTGIAEVAAARQASGDPKHKDNPLRFLQATGWVTQGNREYIAVAVSTFTANGGDLKAIFLAAKTNLHDPMVAGVVNHLSKTFK